MSFVKNIRSAMKDKICAFLIVEPHIFYSFALQVSTG